MVLVFASADDGGAQDPRIAKAFALLDADDIGDAIDLAQLALDEAASLDDEMAAREVLAVASYLADAAEQAIVTLADFDSRSVSAYGWDDPRRIATLDYLQLLYLETENTKEARDAGLRKIHLMRTAPDFAADFPFALLDVAALELAAGDPLTAALMALEVAVLAVEGEGVESSLFNGAIYLHARAQLLLDDPLRALAWAGVAGPVSDGLQAEFEAEFSEYVKNNGASGDQVLKWRERAAQFALFDALEMVNARQSLFWEALENGDIATAENIATAIRAAAHGTDFVPFPFYEALATRLPQTQQEKALPWLDLLIKYPPSYLASRPDVIGPIRRAEEWLVANAQHAKATPYVGVAYEVAVLLHGEGSQQALGLLGLRADAMFSDRNFVETEKILGQMRASPTISNFPELEFQAYVLQGELDTALNNPQQAEAAFQSAANLFYEGRLERDTRWTVVLDFTARTRATLGDTSGAIAIFEQALDHEAGLGDPFSRRAMFVRFGLAAMLNQIGEHDRAIRYFEETRSIVEDNAAVDASLTAAWRLLYAEVLEAAGRGDAADKERATSLPEDTVLQSTSSRILLSTTQAELALAAGDLQEAQQFAKDAVSLMAADDPDLVRVLIVQARVAVRQGKDGVALDLLRRLAGEARKPARGRVAALLEVLPLYVEVVIRLAQNSTGPESINFLSEGFEIAQEYKSLTAGAAVSKAAVRWQSTPELAAMLRQIQDSEAAVQRLNAHYRSALSIGENQAAASQKLAVGIKRHDGLKKQLATDFPTFDQLFGTSTIKAAHLAAQLSPDEVVLMYVTSDDDNGSGDASSTIMGVTHDTIMSGGTLARSDLEDLTRRLRCHAALTDPNCAGVQAGTRGSFSMDGDEKEIPVAPVFDLALAHRAYEALIAPMAPILKGKSHIIIVPDATLVSMPFHTLVRRKPDPSTTLRTADWLIRDTTIFVAPTVASLFALRGKQARPLQGPFLGVGDPLIGRQSDGPVPYDCNQTPLMFAELGSANTPPDLRSGAGSKTAVARLSALPDTRCELRAAAAYFGDDSTVLLHENATESEIKALNRSGALAQFQTISFATHGLIAGELGANEAGLVLTPPHLETAQDDGLLTSGEIAQLNLNADMVFLSACNTAAGSSDNDEGLSGLASAFFYAGARSILVSHWPVYSDAATRLTTGMLAQRKQDPDMGYAQALNRTMVAILDDPASDDRQRHPAYWAPFMIVGEGAGSR